MKRIHFFQHVPFEDPGTIQTWASARGHERSATLFHEGGALPHMDAIDWLVVMGGPMSVEDEAAYPWLAEETRFIGDAIQAGKVVIGICLGAQLIAHALGASVRPNAFKEIGWYPVHLQRQALDHPVAEVFPAQWSAFHWHGDTFEIPEGARLLASTEACRNQGFVYGDRVVALQFHLEMTREGAGNLVRHCAKELKPDEFVATADQILAADLPFEDANAIMERLLDHLDAV